MPWFTAHRGYGEGYYKVENLKFDGESLTQIRAEMGQLELDETFTARSQINEILLRIWILLRILEGNTGTTRPYPPKAVQDSMELQMSAERRKGSNFNSEGDRESAVNSARGKAEATRRRSSSKATILQAEAQQRRLSSKPKQNASSKSSRLKHS